MTEAFTKRGRVLQKAPRACNKCCDAKVGRAGVRPCARCVRRKDHCLSINKPKVSVSERCLLQIEKQVANAAPATAKSTPLAASDQASTLPNQVIGAQYSNSMSSVGWQSSPNWIRSETDAQLPAQMKIDSPNTMFSRSHPLKDVKQSKDPTGRYRADLVEPTLTWTSVPQLIASLGPNMPKAPKSYAEPFNTDLSAFRLRWNPVPFNQPPDTDHLPPVEYFSFLFKITKFRLGIYFQIIDEKGFLATLNEFKLRPQDIARRHRLWFIEYLLILAFGKAFTANTEPSKAPAGSHFAARAMALIPDFAQLNAQGLLAIEVLALAALYFHSIDMGISAYQYIEQALRLCYIEGIHRELPYGTFSEQITSRCKKLWWGTYVLHRQLSARMEIPTTIRDEDITAMLPWDGDKSTMAVCLTLSVKLSRLLATITSTVYTVKHKLGVYFIENTKTALRGLAEVVREGDQVMALRNMTQSRVMSSIALMYHLCITQVTKPLMMCLLRKFTSFPSRDLAKMMTQPISALLKSAVSSSLSTLKILSSLEKQRLLDSFLPFDVECAYSSAASLCIMHTVLPEYIKGQSWAVTVDNLFTSMIKNGSIVAGLRRNELYYLNMATIHNSGMENSSTMLTADGISECTVPDVPQQNLIGTAWEQSLDLEEINMYPDSLFDLAQQFGIDPETDIMGRLET